MKKVILLAVCLLLLCTNVHAQELQKIRFGILPVLDTLPLQVAKLQELFKKQGLDVELIPFNSALERDVAMQAGQLDGCFGDMVSAHLLVQSGVKTKIALVSYHTTPDRAMFGIVSSSQSGARSLKSLEGKSIGISKSTIIEFLLDRFVAEGTISPDHFKRLEIKKFPIRLQMLSAGKIDSALLPEPLLSLMEFKGGKVVVTDEKLNIPLTVLCLNENVFANNGQAYKGFVRAYSEAVDMIDAKPNRWKELMAKTCRIPGPLVQNFKVYSYPQPVLPTADSLRMVQGWMLEKGILKKVIPFSEMISPIDPETL
ncbi:MAG: ABC transporter substrate-binding protein [Desulfovibrio sp.]